jgi:hypothetical protein
MTETSSAPDLSTSSVRAYLAERGPDLLRCIAVMESVERWTLDRVKEVADGLEQLAAHLQGVDWNALEPAHRETLIDILAYVSTGRALMLIMWIDEDSPGFAANTLIDAKRLTVIGANRHAAGLLLERFELLERMRLLSRVFHGERLEILEKVLAILSGRDEGAGVEHDQDIESEDEVFQ